MITKQWTYEGEWWSIKSNMKWSHINNECNDGRDNELEPIGEDHSSHSKKHMTKWIQRRECLGKLIYEPLPTNILDKVTLGYQYTCQWGRILCTYTHVLIFLFFSFFLCIYKCIYPEHKQMSPKEIRSIMDGRVLKH